MLKKAFDFFIFSSLFIACCAVLMVLLTETVFLQGTSPALLLFVFSGAISSYNFHWLLTPPQKEAASPKMRWNISYRRVHLVLLVLGIAGALVSSLLLLAHWQWLAITAFLTFMYSAPRIPHPAFNWVRKIAIGKTIFLALAWTHVTALLPLLVQDAEINRAEWLFVVSRFLFIYPICIFFDRRDIAADRRAGVKSLITLLPAKGINILFWTSLLLHLVTTISLSAWLDAVTIFFLLLPALPLAWLYQNFRDRKSDYLYYFVLDGLMMLSAPLVILAKFAR